MSCQSLAARAFAELDMEAMAQCGGLQRSVRFSSESRGSTRASTRDNDVTHANTEGKRDNTGSMSLTALSVSPVTSQQMSQSAPTSSATFDLAETPLPEAAACRFPKLEECAHFHYERVSLGGVSIETQPCPDTGDCPPEDGWVCLKVRSHVNQPPGGGCDAEPRALGGSWSSAAEVGAWTLTRHRGHLLQLDHMLHRCIYDRKVSGLPNLSVELNSIRDDSAYRRLISHYVHHLSIIADDSLNCGPVLNWLQMDNKGHKLLVANEDSSSINTPAVAAAYSVRKYVSQARDEISFDVGDMISIIDMPGPSESVWWRGKRGFRVGFFPHHCVAVIGDKVPRHMTHPPPIVGSVAVAPIKPVLRKHGKLISLFRSFILSRPSRRSLKQQGILRERVFGCDLGEHLLNCGHDVPLVLVSCANAIESRGAVDGIYRLSGGSGLTCRLRAAFDAAAAPDLAAPQVTNDPHALASLLKMYFRELPNPLCTYQLYESFVSAVQAPDEASRLRAVRETVVKLPPPHYRTLAYLMRHLRRVSLLSAATGMTARNMAIVWAPNLLRCPRPQHALHGVAVQAVVTEFLICFAEDLFAQEQGADSGPDSLEQEHESLTEAQIELRGNESCRRPKSLPINPPTKLLSLEEARRRGGAAAAVSAPAASGAIAAAAGTQLRPHDGLPKYIEVGSGPNNLPQYHTVLDLPLSGGKRGVKRSPSGWRGLFSRSKQQRAPQPPPAQLHPAAQFQDSPMCGLRPVKSCESLCSETDTLGPLAARSATSNTLKHHTRSASCDSYFEPWQAELADMRLRLAPQERDHHMFSEEDDTAANAQPPGQGDSLCSTPADSVPCSAEPSPRKNLHVDIEAANDCATSFLHSREATLASIGYIDGESPRPAEKRHPRPTSPHQAAAKRVCKDRDSPKASLTDFQTSLGAVKLRERHSPRKVKNSSRYSGFHQPVTNDGPKPAETSSSLSWHGKDVYSTLMQSNDGHSTLIKIGWPAENSSISNLTSSTLNSTPITPVTPTYDPLESDSEISDNKQTIKVEGDCENCTEDKCLKCELKAADYKNIVIENRNDSSDRLSSPAKDISYQNLNRLSNISTSSNSDCDKRKEQEDLLKVMTSSHDSSSSYSNASLRLTDDYEPYSSRPSYINLQSSSTSKSSPGSPLKSPLKSTISITFRSPTKVKDYENIENVDTPTNDRDSVYEDIDLEKNLSIVEDATVPEVDASLPTQQACQPNFTQDLIILESPTDNSDVENPDIYNQVKFFKKSIEEVNAMILESQPKAQSHYENVNFDRQYDSIHDDTLKICDKDVEISHANEQVDNGTQPESIEKDNGNIIKPKMNLNVRELAIRFESPTEQKGPFVFEKFKAEIKYPSLERKEDNKVELRRKTLRITTNVTPTPFKLTKNSSNARSLDENAFVKEFGSEKTYNDRRKSLEVRDVKVRSKFLPDLNLNMEENEKFDNAKLESITPTTENKISLIQRFDVKKPCDITQLIGFETEKKLSRERIEKYKEERRNFLREKYSSQSFRSNPEHLTRIRIKKDDKDRIKDDSKFERRNTVDLGQRMRFSVAKSANNLDNVAVSPEGGKAGRSSDFDSQPRKERMSPSYNIKDMTAIFEQKSQSNLNG